jgi:pre-mRNA-splicing factor 18
LTEIDLCEIGLAFPAPSSAAAALATAARRNFQSLRTALQHSEARHTMEALKKEMERKKREREALAGGGAAAASGPKKWMRRGDVEAARERQYREETAREAAEQAARLRVPCLEHHDAARGAVSSDPAAVAAAAAAAAGLKSAAEVAAAEAAEAAAAPALAPREVKRRLRALSQPISLFAESDDERLVRLRAVEAALPKSNEADLELKKGQMFNETQLYDDQGRAIQAGVQVEHEGAEKDDDVDGGGGDGDGDDDGDAGGGGGPSGGVLSPEELTVQFLRGLLRQWEGELSARSDGDARSKEGKLELATYAATDARTDDGLHARRAPRRRRTHPRSLRPTAGTSSAGAT